MNADEFWKDDPQLFVSFRTSFINKKKRQMEEEDYKCWLQGLYIHQGNGLVTNSLKQFIGNMFSKNRDRTDLGTYPEKPYMELEKDKHIEKKVEERKSKYKDFENSLVYFGTLKQQYKDRIKKQSMRGE